MTAQAFNYVLQSLPSFASLNRGVAELEALTSETVQSRRLKELAGSFDAEYIQAWSVVRAVNLMSNDNPALLLPIA